MNVDENHIILITKLISKLNCVNSDCEQTHQLHKLKRSQPRVILSELSTICISMVNRMNRVLKA